MDLISQIVERAKANKQRIVLPEGTEERTLKAANQILTDGVADLILLGNPDEIMSLAKQWGLGNIGKATIIDPTDHPKKEEYAQLLCELRKKKGMTIEEARKLVVDPLYLGCLIIKAGELIVFLTGIKLPSSIIGMLLLTLFLKLGWIKLQWVQGLSDFLVANLGFFFVPPGVALMLYFDVIEAQFWPIVIATVVSTVLVLVVTGWVHQLVRKSNGIFRK